MKKYILLMSVAVLLIGALAWAQGESPGYGGASGLYYVQSPNLTQDQQKEPVGIGSPTSIRPASVASHGAATRWAAMIVPDLTGVRPAAGVGKAMGLTIVLVKYGRGG
jgi:hypothetical protein